MCKVTYINKKYICYNMNSGGLNMNFQISDELKEKIEMNVKYDIDLKNKLLSGDGNAIE